MWQDTLHTYDHRGLTKTEVNARGDGKVFVYDENGNLISKTDEDGYVTEYTYSPVNLVSGIHYNDTKSASYLYNGTGELIEMTDWNGTTSISRDLLNRITKVTDHEGRETAYSWDNVGNKTVQGYPDGTQADYYYDQENQITEVVDPDGGITKYAYDPNGNKTFKEYPNYETAYYFYDECDQIIELDEYDLGGKKLFKTTYSWDAEGNMLSELQYNHGQSKAVNGNTQVTGEELAVSFSAPETEVSEKKNNGNNKGNNKGNSNKEKKNTGGTAEAAVAVPEAEVPELLVPEILQTGETTGAEAGLSGLIGTEVFAQGAAAAETTAEAEVPETTSSVPEVEVQTPEIPTAEMPEAPTVPTDEAAESTEEAPTEKIPTAEGFEYGNGNGEVPPGQNVDEDGTIVNNGGNTPPGLNRREKAEKPDNPNKPDNPGVPDSSDKNTGKAQQGTHIYTYDELNRMVTSDVSKVKTTYTYDTLGNLTYEKIKNKSVDYQYNELNQLVYRKDSQNQTYTYRYDKRGNRIAETGKKESRSYIYDETNHLTEGTNWKGDKSVYTYNGLDVRINHTQTSHSGSVYDRDYARIMSRAGMLAFPFGEYRDSADFSLR